MASKTSADVIVGSQILWGGNPSHTQFGARVFQEPTGDYTGISFDYTRSSLAASLWTLDEESDWYLVNSGDIFSTTTIAAHQFPIIFTTDNPRPAVSIPLGDFYLGMTTGLGFTNGHPNRNVFGWLELYNPGTELIPIANAVSYNEPGIIVGTTTAVPEPASLLVLAVPLAFLAATRRRHFRAKAIGFSADFPLRGRRKPRAC